MLTSFGKKSLVLYTKTTAGSDISPSTGFSGKWVRFTACYLATFFSLVSFGWAGASGEEVADSAKIKNSAGSGLLGEAPVENRPVLSQSEGKVPSLGGNTLETGRWNSEAVAHYTTGLLLERQGKIEEAIEEFNRAKDLEPDAFTIRQALGTVYFKAGKFTQAEEQFQILLKRDPENPIPHQYLAFLYLALGKPAEAEDHYLKVIEINPELSDAYFALAALYVQERQYPKAIRILRDLIKLEPEGRDAYIQLGRVLSLDEKDKEALRVMKKARSLFPDDEEVNFTLGTIYEFQEKWSRAAKVYEQLLKSQPDSVSLNFRLSQVYSQLKEYDKAIQCYQTIVDLTPGDIRILSTIGLLLHQVGNKEGSLKYFQKILEIDPKNVAVKILIGSLYEEMDLIPQAIKSYEEVISLRPDDSRTYLTLAYLYLKENQFQKAIDLLKDKKRENRDIYFLRGFASFRLEKLSDAAGFFRKAISLSPEDDVSHFYLAVVYEKMGDFPLSIYEFKEAIRLNSQFAEAYNYLAYMYAEKGIYLEEAVKLANQAVSLAPKNGAYLDTLAWVHYKKGMFNLALKELKIAVTLQEDPVIYEHLGDVYYKKREWKKAKEAWGESLRLNPENKILLEKMKELETISVHEGDKT